MDRRGLSPGQFVYEPFIPWRMPIYGGGSGQLEVGEKKAEGRGEKENVMVMRVPKKFPEGGTREGDGEKGEVESSTLRQRREGEKWEGAKKGGQKLLCPFLFSLLLPSA